GGNNAGYLLRLYLPGVIPHSVKILPASAVLRYLSSADTALRCGVRAWAKPTKPVGIDASRGKAPSICTAGSGSLSLAKVMPSSTSPRPSIFTESQPLCAVTIFGATASLMPSFTSVASKLTPQAAPRAMLGQEIDLTESSNFLSASPFEISGFA